MTELLYHTDAYLFEFSATVTALDTVQQGVYLDRTAFYPGGGGQPADTGWLLAGGHRLPVTKTLRGPLHLLAGELPPVGTPVTGRLDRDRRYQLMRTHTAMHILCGVVWRDYGASVTGGDMQPLKGRMDFEFERLQKDLIGEIEARINAEVAAARPIRVQLLPRATAFEIPDLIRTKINLLPEGIQEVRTVEIVGLDLQADGGTHVASTAEVGRLRISHYESKGRINKRIYLDIVDDEAGG
ncbi:MAG: alanyl-tRNA editing protein [Anaerolineae bacterium]|nr:alanyl-tRNA editing protein [Anaerolineae bacterium]